MENASRSARMASTEQLRTNADHVLGYTVRSVLLRQECVLTVTPLSNSEMTHRSVGRIVGRGNSPRLRQLAMTAQLIVPVVGWRPVTVRLVTVASLRIQRLTCAGKTASAISSTQMPALVKIAQFTAPCVQGLKESVLNVERVTF